MRYATVHYCAYQRHGEEIGDDEVMSAYVLTCSMAMWLVNWTGVTINAVGKERRMRVSNEGMKNSRGSLQRCELKEFGINTRVMAESECVQLPV